MFKKSVTIMMTAAIGIGSVLVGGCESGAQTGSVVGGLAGAGIGQLAGGDTEATLIGAAIGTAAGYFIGNEDDKNKSRAQMASLHDEMNTVMVPITNSNGSISQVRLRKQGVGYLGPNGEYYQRFPTEAQLRPLYGF